MTETELAFDVRRGSYYDSVVLMQLQRSLAGLSGVEDAGVVMATPANQDLLRESGLLPAGLQAGADDLLIVVKSKDPAAAREALGEVDSLLQRRTVAVDQEFTPKSLESASRMAPDADWVLISVPGRYAAKVAHEALGLGRHVFLYSDNVSVKDEIEVKTRARAQGRLVMGPDCGTAILHGIGLGFANRVRSGDVGIVAASGTGLQAFSTRLHALGGGVSQALGTGSRDLSAAVGGVTTLQALEFLAQDPATRVISLVSKPPDAIVAARVLAVAQATQKPVVIYLLGFAPPGRRLGRLRFASSLADAAHLAMDPASGPSGVGTASNHFGDIRGLFSGGTLAAEVLQGLQALVYPLFSNAPLQESQRMADPLHSLGHTLLDLGDDQFTVGRLHPMLDNDLRIRRLRQEAADPATGTLLLDLVLGVGSHPDPAAELAPAISDCLRLRPEIAVGVLLVGTDEDPQGLDRQRDQLTSAGCAVFETASGLVEFAAGRTAPPSQPSGPPVRIAPPLRAINVGLSSFFESLQAQGAQAVHVDWRPPAGGDEALMEILARMGR